MHLVEQLPIDERFVPAEVFLALVRDDADVVRVLEHLVDLRDGDGACRAALGGAGAQASVGELVLDVLQSRLAGGVHLESEPNEGRTLFVDGDSADLAAVDAIDGVDVADGRFAERSALFGLLTHLVGDVGTFLGGAELVERGEDAVHELPDRSLVDRLGGGDEGDAALLQLRTDDGIVEAVPGHARELVDDDVVDVPLGADALQHLLERQPLTHFPSGAARLDVLVDDRDPELVGLAVAGLALRWEGDTFRVVVGVDLARCGDAEVDHRPLASRDVVHGLPDADVDGLEAELVGMRDGWGLVVERHGRGSFFSGMSGVAGSRDSGNDALRSLFIRAALQA
nr:hypothetical protein [Gulosibacter chungangensis]